MSSSGSTAAISVIHVNDIAHVGSGLVAGLQHEGVDAELWTPSTPGASWSWPVKALSVPARVGMFGVTGVRLRARRPDIVHLHYATQVPSVLLAGTSFVVHCHGSDIRTLPRASIAGRLLASVLDRAARVYVATPDLLDPAAAFRADVRWVPNPLDTERFKPAGDADVDLLVGTRLTAVKGATTAVEVVRSIVAARPQTTVTIVDSGTEVAAMAEAAGARASIIPPVSHGQMPDLLRRHRLAIGQFAVGALGQYELESMASGTPVLARFAYPDAYNEPPPVIGGSLADMADAALALLDDMDALQARRVEARAWVVNHHELGMVARAHLREYRAILA